MYILFFQKDVDNFEIDHKTCYFGVGGAVPYFFHTFLRRQKNFNYFMAHENVNASRMFHFEDVSENVSNNKNL